MSKDWPLVKLGDICTRVQRGTKPVPGVIYRQLGVKLWGVGAYERETMDGANTKYAELYKAEEGDIVVNKIWARNGSVAVVSHELEGCYASGEFPMFAPDRTILDPRWIHWITKTAWIWAQCDAKSRGTSGKNRIKPEQFLNIKIPLPPLAEQQRVVERIEAVAALVAEAQALRKEAVEEAEQLMSRASNTILEVHHFPIVELGNALSEAPRNGLSPKKESETGNWSMLRINAVSSTPTQNVDLTAAKVVAVTDHEAEPFQLRDGDVFIVRYNGDINRVAYPAIYRSSVSERIVYPDKLMRLRANRSLTNPEYLVYALRSPFLRSQVEHLGRTTAGNIGINGGQVKSFKIPLPDLPTQQRIVHKLDAIQAQVDALKALQAETQAELDSLLGAVLAEAFHGPAGAAGKERSGADKTPAQEGLGMAAEGTARYGEEE